MHENKKMAIVRLVALAIMLINSILAHYGQNPIPVSEDFIYQTVSDIILIATVAYTSYKNNDLTDEAVMGTAVTHKLKNENMSKDEANTYVEAKKNISDTQ